MHSFWLDSIENKNKFNKLEKDKSTDVCIVGAGIFGLTCGYYLTKQGYNVVLLEKEKDIASKTTGHNTAKITCQHNLIYKYLIDSLGESIAKKYLYANQNAIENIAKIVEEEKIDCDFERQNSYVYTNNLDELEKIKLENEAVNSLGFESEFVTSTPLPFDVLGAIKFPNQAEFNPMKYAYGLAKCITSSDSGVIGGSGDADSVGSVLAGDNSSGGSGDSASSTLDSVADGSSGTILNLAKGTGEIYIDTLVQNIEKKNDEFITSCKDYVVRSKYVILASHYPFIDRFGYYFLKMYQSTSYVIAVDNGDKTFDGMYINSEHPTFSYRFVNGSNEKKLLLVSGADHKTGSKIYLYNAYNILEDEVRKYYPNCKVLYRWNTEDCITLDKIPYIGEFSHFIPNMYIATGFNKWGMTSSNVAANIIVDKILGRENEYEEVFKATRLHPIKNNAELGNMIKETANSLVINKFKVPEVVTDEDLGDVGLADEDRNGNKENTVDLGVASFSSIDNDDNNVAHKADGNFTKIENDYIYKIFANIENDTGHVLEYKGQKVGFYKDKNGKIYTVKPICTHLGCLLSWNNLDKTWDCPCHGSRFNYMGHQLYNPAIRDLDVLEVEEPE
jgi:oxidoreductase